MATVRARTTDVGTRTVDEGRIDELAGRLRGAVIRPADPEYDEARSIWNAMIDRRPALIVRCAGAADVTDALEFCRENELLFSVRSVGHNIAGMALCDDGVVIDLTRMNGVRVDPARRRVRAEPGASWGDLDRETQAFGLAVPGGIVSTTGIAGLTLGGGFGWLTRKHGLTCDNLISADVVTAAGERVVASEDENADLFWALRGGGGNFGIVTSFEYEAHPVGPTVTGGMVLHSMDDAPEVLRFYREFTATAPDALGTLAVLRLAPPAPFLPPEVHGQPVVGIAVCYAGPVDEGEDVVRPIREFGEPLADVIGPKPFVGLQRLLDAAQPPGRRYYWKSEYLAELEDGLIDVSIERARDLSSPHSAVLLMQLGGAAARVPADATAAANRDARYILNIAGSWEDAAESDRHVAWTRDFWQAILPYSTGGTYVNFLTQDETSVRDRLRAAYGDSYERLVEVKRAYDPDNLFRRNQNIPPAL